ncbi:MAG: CoA-binding protein [Bacteroidetes bacterium]|nr:CoA-binding protein [Bacteroidota bacterium]
MKATKASIDKFLASRRIAIAGVSRDPKKFGYKVFKLLKDKGIEVFPINPEAGQIDGTPCFKNVDALPVNVHSLLILTPKERAKTVVADALAKGIDNFWIQQMSETPESIALIQSKSVNLVSGECILMYVVPVKGIHKFHRSLRTFFGGMPK